MTKQELLKAADHNKYIITSENTDKYKYMTEAAKLFRDSYIYNSSALEGNTSDTSVFIVLPEDKMTALTKPVIDSYNIDGHAKAYDYMFSLLNTEEPEITEDVIKKFHYFIYYRNEQKQAGQYRNAKVHAVDMDYLPPNPEDLDHLMEHFINQMQSSKRLLHPIEYAALCHKRLMDIHPFEEGNGMVARLLMNFILINTGYGVAIITPDHQKEYLDSLRIARRKSNPDIDPLVILVTESVIKTQLEYCKAAGIEL